MNEHAEEWTVADRVTDWAFRTRIQPGQHRADEHAEAIIRDIIAQGGGDNAAQD